MSDIEAQYNDGQTAKTHRVQVSLSDHSLEIRDAEGRVLAAWPRANIRAIDRGKGDGPLRLSGGETDLARLTVTDDDARALLLQALPQATRFERPTGRAMGKIAVLSAGALASLALIVWVILPFAARQIAPVIPQSVQAQIGAKIADQIIRITAVARKRARSDVICTDEAGLAALARMTDGLTAHSRSDITFRVRVLDVPFANAMALPGGHIFLTRGLIEFVGDANELSAVLGHEIGHVALDHAVQNLIKVGGISALFSLLIGDVAGGAVIIAVGQSIIAGSYQQAAEREADLHAVELMHAAGFDSRSFANFFERIDVFERPGRVKAQPAGKKEQPKSNILDWISTHPPAGERTRAVRRLAKPGEPAISESDWKALQKICK